MSKGSILFAGQMFYHTWYLSRELRKLGWNADVLNWDANPASQMYYHGEDFKFTYDSYKIDPIKQIAFYTKALARYDIFHFSNAHGIQFGPFVSGIVNFLGLPPCSEIRLLKKLGKKIVYNTNGCLDGVSQTSFRSWEGETVCDICIWRDNPNVCSDKRNLEWGALRNRLVDYICHTCGNLKGYNWDSSLLHIVPEVICLDPDFWHPNLPIPPKYFLPSSPDTVKIYHAVGNFASRTDSNQRNTKSTHIYLPLIEQLKKEGYPVELIFATDISNKEVRYLQAQADIVVDGLTFGFYGTNTKEAMMLGKPVICYLRPAFLENIRSRLPDYANEIPVVSATSETIHDVLVDLITNSAKRKLIGQRSREFAVKWHSAEAGAKRMDKIYSELLGKETNA